MVGISDIIEIGLLVGLGMTGMTAIPSVGLSVPAVVALASSSQGQRFRN